MPIVGDPSITVLLTLHLQNEVLHPDGGIRMGVAEGDTRRARLIRAAAAILTGAREAGVPVIHVRMAFRPDGGDVIRNCPIFRRVAASGVMREGSWGADFYEGLGPEPGEAVVSKNRVDGFHGTDLRARIESLGAGHVVMAGVASNSSVETTFRTAADIGWLCTVARDASSAANPKLHAAAMANMALLGEVATVSAIVRRGFAPSAEAVAALSASAEEREPG